MGWGLVAQADAPVRATLSGKPPSDAAAPGKNGQPAQNGGSGLMGGAHNGPLNIQADNGIEWQQPSKAYVARGNAVATRGELTLKADTLTAYYRELPKSQSTEIWRVIADGNVTITRPTETVTGQHGVYDVDQAVIVLTGNNLKLTTPQDTVTARDTLEWYNEKQLAVARGDAVGTRADRRIRADVLAAQIESGKAPAPGSKAAAKPVAPPVKPAGGKTTPPPEGSRIKRIDGSGHVLITSVSSSGTTQVGSGDKGVYDLDTGLATLAGHVNLARGNDSLVGEYGVMDLNNGVSRMLPRRPSAAGKPHGRVQGYVVPQKDDEQTPDASSNADAQSSTDGQSDAE